jgi:glutamate carboxypeptidase
MDTFDVARMVEDLRALVDIESPTADRHATAACAHAVAALGQRLLGTSPDLVAVDGTTHVRWQLGTGPVRVVLIGHLDTVWPAGTLARRPFTIDGDRITGPGTFDMKAGIVQLLHAVASLDDRNGIAILVTSDEEIGSLSSRALVEHLARGAHAALLFEPSERGALKTARKGVGMYRVTVDGRAAHAGLEPERGANATIELAHQVLAVAALARLDAGTTVTPTVVAGGTVTNVVPDRAYVDIDVRASEPDELVRVDAAMQRLRTVVAGTALTVDGGPNRPPMPASASAALFETARRLADELGLGVIEGIAVGGGSDGNFTAAVGTPTLDGLGAVGAGAHADDEHVIISAMPERARLAAALVAELLASPPQTN